MALDVIDEVANELASAGVERALILEIVRSIRQQWGGQQVYVRAIDRAQRDAAIRDALHAGSQITEIAEQVGCHPSTVRRRKSRWLT
jgi:Mor family transcriptional regulator